MLEGPPAVAGLAGLEEARAVHGLREVPEVRGIDQIRFADHHHRGLGLARMHDAGLVLAMAGQIVARFRDIGGGDQRRRRGRGQFVADLLHGDLVAAMAVRDEDMAEAVAGDGLHQVADHGAEGRLAQRQRAAIGHVILAEAGPDDGGDDDRAGVPGFAGGAHGDLVAEAGVGHGGQVRPVLLDRGDGQDDHGILRGQRAEFMRLEAGPVGFRHRRLPSVAGMMHARAEGATAVGCGLARTERPPVPRQGRCARCPTRRPGGAARACRARRPLGKVRESTHPTGTGLQGLGRERG